MTDEHVSPQAERIIRLCGGHKAVADLTGVSLDRVYRWTYPASRRGTGGFIPRKAEAKLIAAAEAGIVRLKASDFVKIRRVKPHSENKQTCDE